MSFRVTHIRPAVCMPICPSRFRSFSDKLSCKNFSFSFAIAFHFSSCLSLPSSATSFAFFHCFLAEIFDLLAVRLAQFQVFLDRLVPEQHDFDCPLLGDEFRLVFLLLCLLVVLGPGRRRPGEHRRQSGPRPESIFAIRSSTTSTMSGSGYRFSANELCYCCESDAGRPGNPDSPLASHQPLLDCPFRWEARFPMRKQSSQRFAGLLDFFSGWVEIESPGSKNGEHLPGRPGHRGKTGPGPPFAPGRGVPGCCPGHEAPVEELLLQLSCSRKGKTVTEHHAQDKEWSQIVASGVGRPIVPATGCSPTPRPCCENMACTCRPAFKAKVHEGSEARSGDSDNVRHFIPFPPSPVGRRTVRRGTRLRDRILLLVSPLWPLSLWPLWLWLRSRLRMP